jgi:hypothetical protein
MAAIFDPTLVKAMFTSKAKKDQAKEDQDVRAFRNTEVPKGKEGAEEVRVERSRRERMRMEMEERRQEYDFKLIKRKFKQPTNDKVYMEPEEIDRMIKQPQMQARAEDLLNLFQNHQFSFGADQCVDLYKRVARAIPMNV